jgi:hypothetical protein
MNTKAILKEKNIIISQIKKYCPVVKSFFDLDLSLKDYSKGLYDFKTDYIQDKLRNNGL